MQFLLGIWLSLLVAVPAMPQDDSASGEIVALADRFLTQARASYEKHDWFEAMEQAERARTAFMTLAELYDSQKRSADRQKASDSVQQCNQLIKLANDARKAAGPGDKAPAPRDPGKPEEKPKGDPPAPAAIPVPRPADKLAVPPAAVQTDAEKSIREIYKADYGKRAPQEILALAKKLLVQGAESSNDPTTRFVLLREAREAALQAGDVKLALATIDETGRAFAVDGVALKVAVVSRFATSAKGPTAWEAAELCLSVSDEAAAQNAYDLGAILVRKAQALAGTPRNPALLALSQARSKELVELQKERERASAAEKTLLANPNDAEACSLLGRFDALLKGDWERGLRFLARGSDARLKMLAERDLSGPDKPELQAEMGNEWWTASEAESSARARLRMRLRAKLWYDRALPSLGGLQVLKIRKRSEEVEDESAWVWSVNLLKIIDPRRDGVAGDWRGDGESLTTPITKGSAWLQIPYSPPEEYDLKIIAARKSGTLDLFVGLLGGGKQILAHIDGGNGEKGGLQAIDNKDWAFNETSYKGRIFGDDKPKTLVFSVRKGSLTFSADGKPWINWKADYRRVTPTPIVPNTTALYLGDCESGYEITQMMVYPVSAPGKRIRPAQ